jgi:NADPH:quinone reductase-like Zn-dependent oxidoreductase
MRTKYLETGKVKSLIDTVFDWQTDGVEALYKLYEKSKSGKAQGKLVLKIADEP